MQILSKITPLLPIPPKSVTLLCLIYLVTLAFSAPILAQAQPTLATTPTPDAEAKPADKAIPAKKAEKNAKKGEKEPIPEPVKPPSWKARYVPAIGFLGNVGLPLSGVNEYLGPGFGGELFGSLDVGHWFLSTGHPYRLRAVLSASGYFYTNKASANPATLMLFPVIGSLQFSYFATKDTRIIARAGAGATFDTLKATDSAGVQVTDSSVAFAYQGDVGWAYNFPNGLELMVLAGYMGQVQTLPASFLNVRVGVAWYF